MSSQLFCSPEIRINSSFEWSKKASADTVPDYSHTECGVSESVSGRVRDCPVQSMKQRKVVSPFLKQLFIVDLESTLYIARGEMRNGMACSLLLLLLCSIEVAWLVWLTSWLAGWLCQFRRQAVEQNSMRDEMTTV